MSAAQESDRGPHVANLEQIREGSTGCVFSRIIAQRTLGTENGTFPWAFHEVTQTIDEIETGQSQIVEQTRRALESPDSELFSLLFPTVTSVQDLTRLVQYLGNTPPFFIKQVDEARITPDNPESYYGVHLRIAMDGGKESWPMVLGPFEHFSPGRRAPVTELIFRNEGTKGNPTTPPEQIGIDDTQLGLTSRGFSTVYDRTKHLSAIHRGGYNRDLSRARIAVVIPAAAWNHGGK